LKADTRDVIEQGHNLSLWGILETDEQTKTICDATSAQSPTYNFVECKSKNSKRILDKPTTIKQRNKFSGAQEELLVFAFRRSSSPRSPKNNFQLFLLLLRKEPSFFEGENNKI
jgi:hypothetical protein